jgi:hypothetical protein
VTRRRGNASGVLLAWLLTVLIFGALAAIQYIVWIFVVLLGFGLAGAAVGAVVRVAPRRRVEELAQDIEWPYVTSEDVMRTLRPEVAEKIRDTME